MIQKGTVVKIINEERAAVLVPRASSCTGKCEGCGGCGSLVKTIETEALNQARAKVGDIVTLESETKTIFSMMFLVFICPVIGAVLFYVLASYIFSSEAARALCSFAGLAVGGVGALIYNYILKKRDIPVVSIVAIETPARKD